MKKIKKILLNYYYKFINSLVFDYVGDFHEGFAKVYIEGKGRNLINTNGELVWKEDIWFDYVSEFSDGFAEVVYKGDWYKLNTKGELIFN